MSRLKYALIGCGHRGRDHLETIMQMKDSFQIVAVCDAHLESAQNAAATAGVKFYTDVRELVVHEQLDICDVVVPAELHHAISCFLSSQGIHQNVETPLAPTIGLMKLMIETAEKYDVKLQTSENFPFLPVEQFVNKIIRTGTIGSVHKCYRLFSTLGYHGLAAIRCRMGARPVAVSSIGHTMPIVPYLDRRRRDHTSENLEFYAVDFDNGGIAIAMVGNKNSCLGRNKIVGFETCGERGTIITNGNQGAAGGETVNVCTDEDIAVHMAKARTYEFKREFSQTGSVKRIWVDLPESVGGVIEWINSYQHTSLSEGNISLATLLDGLRKAVLNNTEPLWPAKNGRDDQEMVIAARRSIRKNRRPVSLPLELDINEEEAFDRDFLKRFGVHSREDLNKVLNVSFKAG